MAFRSRARRGWATLRAERRTLAQGLVALVPGPLAGVVSGLTPARLTGNDHARAAALVVFRTTSVGMSRG